MFYIFKHTPKVLVWLVLLTGDLGVQGITKNVCTLEKVSFDMEEFQARFKSILEGVNNTNVHKPDPNNKLEQSSLCGQTLVDQSQTVVRGEEAPENAWPWYVYLLTHVSDGTAMCGGSILSEWWILTAGHCMISQNSTIMVYFGLNDITQVDTAKPIKAEKRFTKFYVKDGIGYNDILLLKLESPIVFSDAIRPVCLPEEDMSKSKNCFSIGFGATAPEGEGSKNLMQIKSNPMDYKLCRFFLRYISRFNHTEYLFCADEEQGQGTCSGDSGGPMICKANGKYFIVGVTSTSFRCAESELPSGLVSVYAWVEWIKTTIKSNS
ncbi:CUB and peptidase domain-containing protein 2-like [Physella acuta]|uniref:CUB and peptidase domain-containing protein 2-like n=1 Tax=Physella acuta TaxID=109671 RepID=UPI0027DE3EF3|nr:CUB and peptidase domain-containing protein 2-like [Physella acuta]